MPKRAPHDKIHIEMDLFWRLGYKGFVCPEGIEIETILDHWVVDHERDLMANIIDQRVGDDAPLRYPNGDETRICVTSVETVGEHVREVEEDLWSG